MKNIIFLLILTFFNCCSGYYYTATPQHVPMNVKKGELKTNIGFNSLQLGYSFSDHLSLFTTGYYRFKATNINFETMGGKENSGDNIHSDKSTEINFGGSYFYNYNKLLIEVLIGGGFGNLEFEHEIDLFESDYIFDLNAQKYNFFIQPNVGLKLNEHINLCLSAKFSQQNYYNIESNLILGELTEVSNEDIYFINKNITSLYFIEPGLTFRAGGEHFKVQTQIIPVYNLYKNSIRFREYSFYLSFFIDIDSF